MTKNTIYAFYDSGNYSRVKFWIEITKNERTYIATKEDLKPIIQETGISEFLFDSTDLLLPHVDNRLVVPCDYKEGTNVLFLKRYIDCLDICLSQFYILDKYLKDSEIEFSPSYYYFRDMYRYCLSLLEHGKWNIRHLNDILVPDPVKDRDFYQDLNFFYKYYPRVWMKANENFKEKVKNNISSILMHFLNSVNKTKISNLQEKHRFILKFLRQDRLTTRDLMIISDFYKYRMSEIRFALRIKQNGDLWTVESGIKHNGRFRSGFSLINGNNEKTRRLYSFFIYISLNYIKCYDLISEIVNSRTYSLDVAIEDIIDFFKDHSQNLINSGVIIQYPSIFKRIRKAQVMVDFKIKAGSLSRNILNSESVLEFNWKLMAEGIEIDENELLESIKCGSKYIIINDSIIEVDHNKINEIIQKLEKQKEKYSEGVNFLQALTFESEDVNVDYSEVFVKAFEKFQQKSLDKSLLGNFKGELRPYQLSGVKFLNELESAGFGTILADDMGLGKTVQIIALITMKRNQGFSLIVVPTTVLYNWENEFKKFAPELKVYTHYGPDRAHELTEIVKENDILLTTYGVLKKDLKFFRKIKPARIVIDEAQSIKNPKSDQATAVKSVESDSRIALTGTPIENRLMELWSIMDFCNRGLLSKSQDFSKHYEIPIIKNNDGEKKSRLKQLISPFLLRRMKSDKSVLNDLPPKQETDIYLPITEEQIKEYDKIIKQTEDRFESENKENRGMILATITKLKQICNGVINDLGEYSSTKFDRVLSMVKVITEEKNKVLIFTQFVETGNRLKDLLKKEIDHEVLFFHGNLSLQKRERVLKEFNENDRAGILILSLRAGGVGLNLTCANYVIHYDRWWNPAVENQAIDRVHRIGQMKKTFVYKFICKGTLEEKIEKLVASKIKLSTDMLEQNNNFLSNLSKEEFMQLIKR
ncbi:MAG: DEAD/DEAH box helicase family protein [Candidatus Delongbacteria bacterium]|nr:DEAD/DEAH box helicase family protein [Candidatus Delongbacteria bacterium]MBN2836219.1 DEAD/DEAH box helicase family protein [Candidatus Delongbacteria bacterium]